MTRPSRWIPEVLFGRAESLAALSDWLHAGEVVLVYGRVRVGKVEVGSHVAAGRWMRLLRRPVLCSTHDDGGGVRH